MYKHYKYNTPLSTSAFFLADSEVSTLFKMSEEMNTLLKQMMEQINKLQEQVNTLQRKQSTTAAATGMEMDNVEQRFGGSFRGNTSLSWGQLSQER